MKTIRVAYDVSFCGELHGRAATATGIGRVIENVAARLAAHPEVELCMTGCYGGDPRPALTSAKARRYWRERWAGEGVPFLDAARSRTGLGAVFREALLTANRAETATLAGRLWRKGLNAVSRIDTTPRRFGSEIDLFHAPAYPLPSRGVSGRAARIVTVHDLIPLGDREDTFARRMTRALLEELDPARDWAIAVSGDTRRALCAATGIALERTAVIPLAAEPFFCPRRDEETVARIFGRCGRTPGPFFLSVANPQPRKNIPLLIRAFAELARKPGFENFTLLLAGSPKLGCGVEEIDAQIARLAGEKERVIRLGGVSDEELCALYSHCTAFVFPSLQEGFGLPPLEAMQCGAPVIASNATALPEVTGDAALLVSPEDENGFFNAMRAVALDAELQARLSASGLRQAARFSWDQTAATTLAFYRQAVS